MSIFLTQNPGIGGLDELTLSEEVTVQTIIDLASGGVSDGDKGDIRIGSTSVTSVGQWT